MGNFKFLARAGLAYTSTLSPKDCKSGLQGRVPNMIDTKVILALALLLSTLKIGIKPPAGGLPIPQHGAGTTNAQ